MRRWLLVATLTACAIACGIDARGLLDTGGTTATTDGGGPLGQPDGSDGTPTDSGGAGEGSPMIDGAGPSRGRVTNGLILLYELEENGGDVAKDTSGVAPALDLGIPPNVKWMPKALSFDVAAHAKTLGPATKIVQRCGATNAITVEAWFRYVGCRERRDDVEPGHDRLRPAELDPPVRTLDA
jgi:hypothetical protein